MDMNVIPCNIIPRNVISRNVIFCLETNTPQQPRRTEAWGLKEAINFLGSMNLLRMSIELEYKQVVYDISNKHNTNSDFGAVLNVCRVSFHPF